MVCTAEASGGRKSERVTPGRARVRVHHDLSHCDIARDVMANAVARAVQRRQHCGVNRECLCARRAACLLSAMPSSTSHSPRRKRIRRYLSATGTRWSGRPPSSSSSKPRRGSSASTAPFSFSPHDTSDRSDSDYGHELDDGDSALFSPPGRFMPLPEDRDPPLAYASLPPTPISSSPQPDVISRSGPSAFPSRQQESTRHTENDREGPPFSLWDYLREELLATDFDSHQELKWERVGNFLSMPVAIEKVRGSCL